MKVWVIGRNYPQPSNRMKGSFELEQAKMLAKQNVEVCYLAVSLHPIKKIKSKGIQKWNEDGVTILTYSQFFFPRIKQLYFGKMRNKIWTSFLEQVEKENGKPDVIHLHYPVMMLLADVLEKYQKRGIKIVVTEHWMKVLKKNLDHYELYQQKKYVDYVDSYICVGHPLKKAILDMTNSKREILVVPNVVNANFIPSNSSHSGFRFVAVGRLVKIKQFDKIISAFAENFKDDLNVSLVIVGDGEEFHELQKLIQKLNMGSQVVLTGSLNRKETAKKVAESDCLVCYSSFETFGVPIIEAWSCGIPAISTTACSVMDNFDSNLGIEISPYDYETLKKSMMFIYKHHLKYKKEYIIDFARKHYSEEAIGGKLINIYNEVCKVR